MAAPTGTVPDVRHRSVTFAIDDGPLPAVSDVSFELRTGETLALVGESGSGKSVTSLAIMRLTPLAPRVSVGGSVLFTGTDGCARDLVTLDADAMRMVRGNEISMVFQEPITSLNPVHRIGEQIAEAIVFHQKLGTRAAMVRAAKLLDRVGIADARQRLAAWPHHLSGGMRQRVMIAMALACNPRVLIADEPTTALNVTVQAQILELLKELQQATGMAVIFVTHNLGVVAEIADRVMVMYAGRIVEKGDVVAVMTRPLMPYTQGLLRSVPRMEVESLGLEPLEAIPVISHGLAIVGHLCDRVAVMYLGRIVEIAPTRSLFRRPCHPDTEALLTAVPVADPTVRRQRVVLKGDMPSPLAPPSGCAFRTRCRYALAACADAVPPLREVRGGHLTGCIRDDLVLGRPG